jgi:uncharacterized protein with HEPN domain
LKKLPENDPVRIRHMLDAALMIQRHTGGLTQQAFFANDVLTLAIVRLLEIVGEVASKVTDQTRQQYPRVAWQDVADMRNHIAHEYFNVDLRIVWDTVQISIPELIQVLPAILAELENPQR